MRRLIARVKGDKDPWDLKLAAGGLVDIEFLAQYLILRHAHDHPALMDVSTRAVLESAEKLGLIGAPDAKTLLSALGLMTDVTQMLRLTLDPGADPRAAGEAVQAASRQRRRAAGHERAGGCLSEARHAVRAIFRRILSSAERP